MLQKVFSDDEIIEKIRATKNTPDWIEKARKYHSDWKALVYGEGFRNLLLKIEHIESDKRAEPRRKYSRPIKDTFEKHTRPIDSVYAAVGGSKDYSGIKNENERKRFLETISNIRENKSIESFLQTYWASDLYIVDPSGMIFMEYYETEWIKPVYKSICSIRDYECDGQKVKWVLFEPEKINNDGKITELYRFVDAVNDVIYKKEGETLTKVEDRSFKHPFGEVPALICSDKQRLGEQMKLSPFDKIKEDLEEYLRDQSILTIYKFLNGFPIPVYPGVICSECNGTGKKEHQKCETCDGEGLIGKNDVTDKIIIPIDLTAEGINFPQNIGYFISPDLEVAKYYDEILAKKTMSQYDAIWGVTIERDQSVQRTATEIMLNAQPKIHKLNVWSDVAQFMETQITEWVANWMMPDKNKNEPISSIYYGRIYLLRTTQQILDELTEAIKNNLPDSIKSKLYTEYITTKYKNDPQSLMTELKKSRLEYWPFYSVKDVKEYMGSDSARKKIIFNDWWESLTMVDIQKDEGELEKMRDIWVDEKIMELDEEKKENVDMFNQNIINNKNEESE